MSPRLQRRLQELRLALPPSSPLKRVLDLTEVSSVAGIPETLDPALGG